jgi:predicted permease
VRLTLFDRVRAFLARARDVTRRRKLHIELDDELRTHLELEAAYNIERGMSPSDATRAARVALGGVQNLRERVDDARGLGMLEDFTRDIRFATRQLRRTPVLTASIAATLAIGIGATTAVFAVIESVILKPLPYPDAGRLVGVWWSLPAMGIDVAPQSSGTYFAIRKLATSFEGLAILDRAAVNLASGAEDAHPERVTAANCTASMFSVLGTTFVIGRGFGASDDVPGAPPVAVISEGMWRRRFGGDPHVIGEHVVIDNAVHTIVGVASDAFHFPDAATQLWLPMRLDSSAAYGGAFAHLSFARLRPGVTPEQAKRELTRLIPRIGEVSPNIAPSMPTAPFLQQVHAGIVVRPMRDDLVGGFNGIALIASAAGVLLFAIALANAASLLLTRAEARQRELALRVVLGASTGRVLAQFVSESLLLGALGGVSGLAIATIATHLVVRAAPPGIPRLSEIRVDPVAIAFAVGVTIVMAFACSLIAVLQLDLRNLGQRLREGPRGGTAARDRQRTRRTLVVTQLAFATVLVSGAALLLQNVDRLRRVNPGFDPTHVFTAWLSLPAATYARDSDLARFTSQLLERVTRVPGVTAAGVSSKIPMYALGQTYTPVWSDDDAGTSATLPPSNLALVATGGFFQAQGIPLVAGRAFDTIERQNPYEVVINRSLARAFWGDSTGARAIGRRLRLTRDPKSQTWYTVIGVIGSVADTSLTSPPIGVVYLADAAASDPDRSAMPRVIALSVRSAGDPRAIRGPVERAIAEVDRSVPPFNAKLMTDVLRDSTVRLWFMLMLLTVTAIIALLLAALGLYGVLSFIVNARAREMSIRIAMGALPSTVAAFVTRQGAVLGGIGIVIGAAAFLVLSRYAQWVVAGLSRPGFYTVAAAPVVLLAVTVVASWVPARRASRADPARALSTD